jgi:hypothetical protein
MASAARMCWPWFSVVSLESTLPKCGCCTPEWTYLPSGKPEECGLDRPRLRLVDCVTAFRREVTRVGFGLGLQHAVLDGVEHGARLNGSGSGGTTQRFLFAFAQIGTHENWLEQHPYLNMDAMTRRLTGHWTLNLLA